MGSLIYATSCSLDGYIEDASGKFDWSMPSDELHQFFNDLMRPIETNIYGRRLYEVMSFWETAELDGEPPVMVEFAELWRASEKIVISTTLEEVTTSHTTLRNNFDPAEIRALVDAASSDVAIGGAELAGEALRAGLLDEVNLTIFPVSVGGGKPALPVGTMQQLELLELSRFEGGTVNLRYAVKSG